MSKLKVAVIEDDKPATLTLKLPAKVHRDLLDYAEILKQVGGRTVEPAELVPQILARFMTSDRGFLKLRRARGLGRKAQVLPSRRSPSIRRLKH